MSSDLASRRSSGRARKPTAKLEALSGIKFNSTDADTFRTSQHSQSPAPSLSSLVSTSGSPHLDSLLQPTGGQTSPSATSTNPSLELSIEGEAFSTQTTFDNSPADSLKRESRRTRKPTQRALEATEVMPTTRKQRHSKTSKESPERRLSVAPSEVSLVSGHIAPLEMADSAGQSIHRERKPETDDALPDDLHVRNNDIPDDKDEGRLSVSRRTRKSLDYSEQSPPISSPSRLRLRHRSRANPVSNTLVETRPDVQMPRSTRSRSSAVQFETTKEAVTVELDPVTADETQPSQSDDGNAIGNSATAGIEDHVGNASQRPRRSHRASVMLTNASSSSVVDDPTEQKEPGDETPRSRPRRSTSKPISYASTDPEDYEKVSDISNHNSGDQNNPSSAENAHAKAKDKQKAPGKLADDDISVSPVGTPKKSLKLIFRSPRLKMPHLPSKLRYSIQSHELTDTSPPPAEKSKDKTITPKVPTSRANKVKGKTNTTSRPPPPVQQVKASLPLTKHASPASQSPQKLSRRAQAKADAAAMGRVRQAAVPLTQNFHGAIDYVAASSHYVPSARLISPSMGCNLFCLDPPARILAFAQIAAESNDSDEDEISEDGKPPQIYEKWLEKGRDRFCVCDKPSHAHNQYMPGDATSSATSPHVAPESRPGTEQVVNQDIAAALPKDTVLPIPVPPVNSIMRKSQGRRVSALYNVLAGGSSSSGSVDASRTSLSHSHSPSSYSPSPMYPLGTGASADAPNHSLPRIDNGASLEHSATSPQAPRLSSASDSSTPFHGFQDDPATFSSGVVLYDEERQRWDREMLTRIRDEADLAGVAVREDMTYNQIKALLEAKKASDQKANYEDESEPSRRGRPQSRGSEGRQNNEYSNKAKRATGLGTRQSSEASPSNFAAAAYSHTGFTQRSLPLEEEDDPLMQIIDDSVRITRERNAARAATLNGSSTTNLQGADYDHAHISNGAQLHSPAPTKRKRAPTGSGEGKLKRQRKAGTVQSVSNSPTHGYSTSYLRPAVDGRMQ